MTIKKVKLGDCCQIVSGSTPKTGQKEYWDGQIFWATPKDLSSLEGKYISDTSKKITEKGYKSCSTQLLPPNSILLSSRAPIGHVAINTVAMCTNQGFKNLIPHADKVIPEYLYYWLTANKDYLQGLGNGATFKEISKTIVEKIEIPLPSLEEQKRIVRELDAADALRQKRKQAISLLDDYLKAVFWEMFGDPVENPKGWEKKEFHEICSNILGGGTPSKSNVDFYIGNIPWVTPKDMKMRFIRDSEDHISEEAVNNSSVKIIPQKSVLMVIRSGILKHTLPVAINDVEVTINQDMKAYVIDPKFSNPFFVLFFFEVYANHLLKKVRAVTADNIKFDDIKSILMILPPAELQNKFSDAVKKVELMKEKMSTQANQTESNFNALMQNSFKV